MVHFITLGFAPSRILEKGMQYFYETIKTPVENYQHHYLEQCYPVDKASNIEACVNVVSALNMIYYSKGLNLGLHQGFNHILNNIDLKDDDIIIAYDPDFHPLREGWDVALVNVLKDPRIGWATLANPQSVREMTERGYEAGNINGETVWITHSAVTNITCGWKASFLKRAGGLTENRPFYGHLEAPMFHALTVQGLFWAFVHGYPDSDDLRNMHDQDYTDYKWVHAHEQTWNGDFESWLNAGKPREDKNWQKQGEENED